MVGKFVNGSVRSGWSIGDNGGVRNGEIEIWLREGMIGGGIGGGDGGWGGGNGVGGVEGIDDGGG